MWVADLHLTEYDRNILTSGVQLYDRPVDSVNQLHSCTDGVTGAVVESNFSAVDNDCMRSCTTSRSGLLRWRGIRREQSWQHYFTGCDEPVEAVVCRQSERRRGSLAVNNVCCAQQLNGSDYGVFTAAFVFEWPTSNITEDLNVKFHVPRMPPHLRLCLERQVQGT